MKQGTDPLECWNLTSVINAAGTTAIGASRVNPEITAVVSQMLEHIMSMDRLQSVASEIVARATGVQAGSITACSAAAITFSVAHV